MRTKAAAVKETTEANDAAKTSNFIVIAKQNVRPNDRAGEGSSFAIARRGPDDKLCLPSTWPAEGEEAFFVVVAKDVFVLCVAEQRLGTTAKQPGRSFTNF